MARVLGNRSSTIGKRKRTAEALLAPFMIHEALPTLTETAFGSHPCCVVSVTYIRTHCFHGGNTGSNPVGDAKPFRVLAGPRNFRRHKKAQLWPDFDQSRCLITGVFTHFERFFTGTKRHTFNSMLISGRRTRCTQQPYDITLSLTFVKCDCLCIGIEGDPARSVTEWFLCDFISVLFCLSREEYVWRKYATRSA